MISGMGNKIVVIIPSVHKETEKDNGSKGEGEASASSPNVPDSSDSLNAKAAEEGTHQEPLKASSFFGNVWVMALFSVLFGFFAVLLGSPSTSPLFVGIQFAVNDVDPSFFLYLGFSFASGVKPYLGAFDQKGLYIYLIEALGYSLGGRFGVFGIQVLLDSLSCFAIMLFGKKIISSTLYSYLLGLFFLIVMISFRAGNHTGELLMPWISFSLLFYFLGIKTAKPRYFLLGSVFAGLEAAFAIGSRPTEAAWGLGLVFFYFLYSLRHKTGLQLLYNALVCFFSLAVVVLAYVLIAYYGGYLYEMFEAVVVQGLAYVGNHNGSSRTGALVATCVGVTFLFALTFIIKKKHGTDVFLLVLSTLAFSGAANIVIARMTHYWLSSLPLIAFEIALAIAPLLKIPEATTRKLGKGLIIGLSSISLAISTAWVCLYYCPSSPIKSGGAEISSCYEVNRKTRENLDTVKQAGGDVYLIDANSGALLYLGQTSKNRYFTTQTWWSSDNKNVVPSVIGYITGEDKPTWIIVDKDTETRNAVNPEIYSALLSNYYSYESLADDYYMSYYHVR